MPQDLFFSHTEEPPFRYGCLRRFPAAGHTIPACAHSAAGKSCRTDSDSRKAANRCQQEDDKPMKISPRRLALLGGAGIGLLNGLLGAGGGMLAVPLLTLLGVEGKKSHATALCIILPLSAAAGCIYWARGWVSPLDTLPYLPAGLLGGWLGGRLMKRLPVCWLKLAFGLLLWAGWSRAFG